MKELFDIFRKHTYRLNQNAVSRFEIGYRNYQNIMYIKTGSTYQNLVLELDYDKAHSLVRISSVNLTLVNGGEYVVSRLNKKPIGIANSCHDEIFIDYVNKEMCSLFICSTVETMIKTYTQRMLERTTFSAEISPTNRLDIFDIILPTGFYDLKMRLWLNKGIIYLGMNNGKKITQRSLTSSKPIYYPNKFNHIEEVIERMESLLSMLKFRGTNKKRFMKDFERYLNYLQVKADKNPPIPKNLSGIKK